MDPSTPLLILSPLANSTYILIVFSSFHTKICCHTDWPPVVAVSVVKRISFPGCCRSFMQALPTKPSLQTDFLTHVIKHTLSSNTYPEPTAKRLTLVIHNCSFLQVFDSVPSCPKMTHIWPNILFTTSTMVFHCPANVTNILNSGNLQVLVT